MTGSPNRAERRNWPKRRQWLDRIAADRRLTSGAKGWLILLARRSDDQGKPVWGNQRKMGEQIGRCDRSVRRYRLEAEELGYVRTFRSKPLTGPDGRFCRRKSNAYYLCLPPRESAVKVAPRRRQRAPYCVVRTSRARGEATAPRFFVPDLPDSDDLSTPYRGASTATHPPDEYENGNATHPEQPYDPEIGRQALAEMRAKLQNNTIQGPVRSYK